MVGGNDEWQQKMMGPMGGSGGWLSEKTPKKITCLFLFYPYLGGWSDPNMDISIFFCFFIEPFPKQSVRSTA